MSEPLCKTCKWWHLSAKRKAGKQASPAMSWSALKVGRCNRHAPKSSTVVGGVSQMVELREALSVGPQMYPTVEFFPSSVGAGFPITKECDVCGEYDKKQVK